MGAIGLLLAAGCSSNNNGRGGAATRTSGTGTTAAAATAAIQPAATAAGAAVTPSFAPPGGTAAWSNRADGCHGVAAPAGAEARRASDTGVGESEIRLGTVFGVTGAGSTYAPIIKVIQDCFDQVNAEGGIYGRKVRLLLEDDAYVPANTKQRAEKLIEQDKVFAMISNLGTATNLQVYDYLNERKVPHLFVATGASRWGADPSGHPWTVGFPPDYVTIGQSFGKYIQSNLKGKKIGILAQNDDFGRDYITGLKQVLGPSGSAGTPIVDEEIYESTAADVNGQIVNLKNRGVEVLYLVPIPKFAGLALKAMGDLSWKPIVIMADTGLDTGLADLAGGKQNVEGVISGGWYHQPGETSDPGIQTVQAFLAKHEPGLRLDNWPIYGFIAAQLEVETLKRAGVNPTRRSLLQAVESFNGFEVPQLLPGSTVSTSATNHRPVRCIRLNRWHDGAVDYFGDTICADK